MKIIFWILLTVSVVYFAVKWFKNKKPKSVYHLDTYNENSNLENYLINLRVSLDFITDGINHGLMNGKYYTVLEVYVETLKSEVYVNKRHYDMNRINKLIESVNQYLE